jgi:hypothetical protein
MTYVKVCLLSIVLVSSLYGCSQEENSESHASWETQISSVQSAVQKVDPNAVLTRVSANAEPLSSPDGTFNSIETTAIFYSPAGPNQVDEENGTAGSEIWATFMDPSITSTLEVIPNFDYAHPIPNAEDQNNLKLALETVTLSPAQVLSNTISAGIEFSKQEQTNVWPIISLHMNDALNTRLSKPSIWGIVYLGKSKDLFIRLDAKTGDILETFTK